MWEKEIVLSNRVVKVRPLVLADAGALVTAAADIAIWRYMAANALTADAASAYMAHAIGQREAQSRYTFVVEDSAGRVVGSTAFGNCSFADKRVEIGWTWLATQHLGQGFNTNVKSLLMSCAFDELGMERVEFKTDVLNQRARAALKKIGAVEEGVLRSHIVMPDGRRRDTIYYSVLRRDWPDIRAMHLAKLGVAA